MDFNSQPHKEADCNAGIIRCGYFISTHSLTRRLTVCLISNSSQQENFNSQPHKEADGLLPFICRLDSISTHSLTRRLTKGASCQGSFEAFQLTASQGG